MQNIVPKCVTRIIGAPKSPAKARKSKAFDRIDLVWLINLNARRFATFHSCAAVNQFTICVLPMTT